MKFSGLTNVSSCARASRRRSGGGAAGAPMEPPPTIKIRATAELCPLERRATLDGPPHGGPSERIQAFLEVRDAGAEREALPPGAVGHEAFAMPQRRARRSHPGATLPGVI